MSAVLVIELPGVQVAEEITETLDAVKAHLPPGVTVTAAVGPTAGAVLAALGTRGA